MAEASPAAGPPPNTGDGMTDECRARREVVLEKVWAAKPDLGGPAKRTELLEAFEAATCKFLVQVGDRPPLSAKFFNDAVDSLLWENYRTFQPRPDALPK